MSKKLWATNRNRPIAGWLRLSQIPRVIPSGDAWLGISSTEVDSYCGAFLANTPENALDGVGSCLWNHGDEHIHWLILDLGQTYSIKKFKGLSNQILDPIDIDIYVDDTNHGGGNNWGTSVASGISVWHDTVSYVEVDSTDKDGRYIYIEILGTEEATPGSLKWGVYQSGNPIFDAYGSV